MRTIKSLCLLLLLLVVTACGNKGPVRALKTPLPGPATALELRQKGNGLLLGWQLPTSNLDGSPLTQPPLLDIYRMTFDPKDDCPECFDRSTLLVSINPQLPSPAQQIGQRYLLHDQQVEAGIGYQYKLVTRNAAGDTGNPVILHQTCSQPLPAPLQFQAIAKDSAVQLQWQPASLPNGTTLIGYQIYRRSGEASSPYPHNPQPLLEPRFEDFTITNGTSYQYRVRVLGKQAGQQIEGLASPELEATPAPGI